MTAAGEVEAREIARPPVTIERLLKVMKDVRDDLSARSSLSAEPETVELSQSIWNRLCHWCVEGDAYLTSTRSQDARVEEIRERAEKAKHGPWTFSPQEGAKGHCNMAQVFDENGHALADIEPTIIPGLATDTAAHIAGMNPEATLALLDHITAIEADRERLTKALEEIAATGNRTFLPEVFGRDETEGVVLTPDGHLICRRVARRDLSPPSTSQSEGEG